MKYLKKYEQYDDFKKISIEKLLKFFNYFFDGKYIFIGDVNNIDIFLKQRKRKIKLYGFYSDSRFNFKEGEFLEKLINKLNNMKISIDNGEKEYLNDKKMYLDSVKDILYAINSEDFKIFLESEELGLL